MEKLWKKIKKIVRHHRVSTILTILFGVSIILGTAMGVLAIISPGGVTHASGDTVDEIHYSYGNTPDSVVFDWHGVETTIYYGLDTNYNNIATASNSAVTPVDSTGPFQEVKLINLTPGTTYHYKIGLAGMDHTFQTIPTGDFVWVDEGDTTASNCHPWMTQVQALVAQQNPTFVTHGGDIDYANDCGVAAVHQFYTDIQAWSELAAFQPVWGNHEYGKPGSEDGMTAPPGTPQDSLLNYKGRSFVTNAQTVPNDTATKTTAPGCGWETGSTTNICQGEDWGYFQTGHVLFISYPEPWSGAYAAWQTKADQLMATAQADPNIDFIITYGHRPAYSSDTTDLDISLQTVLNNLAVKYSPTANNPTGKYVLSVEHHVHWEEVFSPINGLVHITDGGGGAGQVNPSTIAANSIYHIIHPAVMSATYSQSQHSLTINLLCGPAYAANPKTTCAYGSVLYSQTFINPNAPAATPTNAPTITPVPTSVVPTATAAPTSAPKQWITNQSVESGLTGWTGKYGASPYVTVSLDTTTAHSGSQSIKVAATTGASNLSSGFNDSPHWVSSTTAGITYSQSAWVKPSFVGQVIVMKLREWQGSTLAIDKTMTYTATSTNWTQLSQTLTAANNGDYLAFAIYGKGISAGQYFNADDFSLTTPF